MSDDLIEVTVKLPRYFFEPHADPEAGHYSRARLREWLGEEVYRQAVLNSAIHRYDSAEELFAAIDQNTGD